MPILTTVPGSPFECRLDHMEIDERGFIHISYFTLTENKFVFLLKHAAVVCDGDSIKDLRFYVSVKRIGPGMTSDDFELDFVDTNPLTINPRREYAACINESEKYVIFSNAEVRIP